LVDTLFVISAFREVLRRHAAAHPHDERDPVSIEKAWPEESSNAPEHKTDSGQSERFSGSIPPPDQAVFAVGMYAELVSGAIHGSGRNMAPRSLSLSTTESLRQRISTRL